MPTWLHLPKLGVGPTVVILALGGYVFWAGYHFVELADESQNELAHAAEVLDNTLENARDNIAKLDPDDPKYLDQFLLDQPYLELRGDSKKVPTAPHHVEYLTEENSIFLRLHQGDEKRKGALPFRFQTELLLSELTFPASFRTVGLVKESGEIILSMPAQSGTWRRRLPFNDVRYREGRFGDNPAWPAVDLKAAIDGRAGKELFKTFAGAASRTRAEIGGTSFEIYLQPLRLQTDKTQRIYLVGLTPSAAVIRQALAMDTTLLALACLAVAILIFGMPFVKLWILEACERFRVVDLKALYISTGALLTLITTVLLSLDAYFSYEAMAKAKQIEIHRFLTEKFTAELREARVQLKDFDKRCKSGQKMDSADGVAAVSVDQIAWLDPTGMQIDKQTPTPAHAKLLPLGNRGYFRAVKDRQMFHLNTEAPEENPFYFGPARSISNGQFYSFISVPSSGECGKGVKKAVAVMSFPLFSLAERPLPTGFGFALLHRDGTVLYHSDPRLALRENLLDEIANAARLRALLLSDVEGEFDTRYHAADHHFYAAPVRQLLSADGPAFVLLTFHQSGPGKYVAAHAFLSTLAWALLPLILWMGAVMQVADRITKRCSWRKTDENGTLWIWTQPERPNDYERATLWIAAIIAAAIGLAYFQLYQGMLLAAVFAPLVAILYIVIKQRQTIVTTEAARAVYWHRWLLIVLAVAMNVLPPIGLQRIIWGHEMGKFVAYSKAAAEQKESDLPEEWAAKLSKENVPASWISHAKAVRASELFGPPALETGTDWPLTGLNWIRGWQDELAWFLPVRNDTAIGMRGQTGKMYAPALYAWIRLLIGFCIAGALLWWWIRWNAGHLLFTECCKGEAQRTRDWWDLGDEERLLLAQISAEGIAHPRHKELIERLCKEGWLKMDPQLKANGEINLVYATDIKRVSELESPGEGKGWSGVAGSIIAGLAATVVFLASTQPELPLNFGVLLSMLTTSVSGVLTRYEEIVAWLSKERK